MTIIRGMVGVGNGRLRVGHNGSHFLRRKVDPEVVNKPAAYRWWGIEDGRQCRETRFSAIRRLQGGGISAILTGTLTTSKEKPF